MPFFRESGDNEVTDTEENSSFCSQWGGLQITAKILNQSDWSFTVPYHSIINTFYCSTVSFDINEVSFFEPSQLQRISTFKFKSSHNIFLFTKAQHPKKQQQLTEVSTDESFLPGIPQTKQGPFFINAQAAVKPVPPVCSSRIFNAPRKAWDGVRHSC